jgi:hypothetical protein
MMGRKKQPPVWIVILTCSVIGVVLGGTSSWAQSKTCLQSEVPSADCLKKSPTVRTAEGMSVGLVAGMSAAIGATWQARRQS